MPNTDPYAMLPTLGTLDQRDCGCGGGDCGGSDLVALERTRFYPRQLVGPEDFTQDQTYFRERDRRHNRMLHGWGIVCGVGVRGGEEPCKVTVAPGYVLGPYGDEIVVDRAVEFDVCASGPATDPCGGADPWCTDVRSRYQEGQPLYLAIRATQRDTRPVRATGCDCGCEDETCVYSRIADGYELAALTELPESYARFEQMSPTVELLLLARAFTCLLGRRECPPCPPSPWVVLADLRLDAERRVEVECAPHRRYVVSFADVFFRCRTDAIKDSLGPVLGYMGKAQKAEYLDMEAVAQAQEAAPGAPPPPPPAAVAAKDASGQWVTVPGTFTVKPGETIRELVRREGDRSLVSTASGETVTVRELFAAAGADPDATVVNVADALGHLEARRLDVPGLRVVREALHDVIDVHGLERLDAAGGSPATAARLPASALRGVEAASAVGKHVTDQTVADIAAEPEDAFVAAATKGLRGTRRDAEADRARAVWTNARRVAALSAAWDG